MRWHFNDIFDEGGGFPCYRMLAGVEDGTKVTMVARWCTQADYDGGTASCYCLLSVERDRLARRVYWWYDLEEGIETWQEAVDQLSALVERIRCNWQTAAVESVLR